MNDTLTPEIVEAIMQKTFGMSAAEYDRLTIQEKAQLAYDRGTGFAGNVAAIGHDGKPVTEQERKVLRPDFGPPPPSLNKEE